MQKIPPESPATRGAVRRKSISEVRRRVAKDLGQGLGFRVLDWVRGFIQVYRAFFVRFYNGSLAG